MKKDTNRRYTQTTLQTLPTPAPVDERHKIAEANSPIAMGTLRSELQAYREGMMNDIQSQIDGLHDKIQKNMSSLGEEAKADIKML